MAPRYIVIEGKRYLWNDLLKLRQEQQKATKQKRHPTLFELREDSRPASQRTAEGRFIEPTLFKVD
jgi:hypothetical protein